MKKLIISGIAGLVLLLSGCANKKIQEDIKINKCYTIDGTVAPKWVCSHNAKYIKGYTDYVVGVGIGTNSGDANLQFQEALATAKDEISQKIKSKVKNIFKNYISSTGNNNKTLDKAMEFVSKQISNNVLYGTEVITSWYDLKSKKLYVLAGVPKENIKKTFEESFKTSLKNNKALWQKIQATKAWEKLEQELEK